MITYLALGMVIGALLHPTYAWAMQLRIKSARRTAARKAKGHP